MGPTAYGSELVATSNQLKPVVLDVLTRGGSYIVFTTQPQNHPNLNVKTWVNMQIGFLKKEIDFEKERDLEEKFRY